MPNNDDDDDLRTLLLRRAVDTERRSRRLTVMYQISFVRIQLESMIPSVLQPQILTKLRTIQPTHEYYTCLIPMLLKMLCIQVM